MRLDTHARRSKAVTQPEVHDCRGAALLTAAVAADAVGLAPVDRMLLFAAAAAAVGAAWLAARTPLSMRRAAASALGTQAVILVSQCTDPAATVASAMAAVWTLGLALAIAGHDVAPDPARIAVDLGAAGVAVAVVAAFLAIAQAELAWPSAAALALAAGMVGTDPLARAQTEFSRAAAAMRSRRQKPATSAVNWAAVALLTATVARAAWRAWGEP